MEKIIILKKTSIMQKVKTDKMLSQLGHLNDEQFKVLFFIYNSINLNSDHTNRVKIYRAVLADLTGKSERTISRITDKLAEQGLIIKDNVSDGSKLYNYYGLPTSKKEEKVDIELQKTEENLVTGGRVKEHERTVKNLKENKSILKDIKEDKVELKELINNTESKQFNINCSIPIEEEKEFEKKCSIEENIPEEESLSEYLARMARRKMAYTN